MEIYGLEIPIGRGDLYIARDGYKFTRMGSKGFNKLFLGLTLSKLRRRLISLIVERSIFPRDLAVMIRTGPILPPKLYL